MDGIASQVEELRPWNPMLGTYSEYPFDNFLLAIYPPVEVASRIYGVADGVRRERGLTRPLRPAHILHVTLCLLRDELCMDAAASAAKGVRCAPFEVSFDRISTFAGNAQRQERHDALPCALSCLQNDNLALRYLHRQLHAPLRRLGISVRPVFAPHVTVLYDPTNVPVQMIEPIRWQVDRFALVHSHYGKTNHEVIESWSLTG